MTSIQNKIIGVFHCNSGTFTTLQIVSSSQLQFTNLNTYPNCEYQLGHVDLGQGSANYGPLPIFIRPVYCMIHQHAFSKGVLGLANVTDVVTKLTNYIKAKSYLVVPYHTKVRWPSLGKVLKRVWKLKEEICLFLALKEKESDFPELHDNDWVSDFALAVGVMGYRNELNTNL